MKHLISFFFCFFPLFIYSREVRYDSLQNISPNNYSQLVGQTLFYPKGEIRIPNLFWANKYGKIYKSTNMILYGKYSSDNFVLNKHFQIEKILSKPRPLIKTRLKENNDIVFINISALFSNGSPALFVEGYIQKCKELFFYKTLYIDKRKCNYSLPPSCNIENTTLASFYCNSIFANNTKEHGGVLVLAERYTSNNQTVIAVEDYLKAKVSKSDADEIIRQAKIRLEHEAREKAERKRIMDSITDVRMKEQQQADLLALVRMKEKYMHKTWYYSLREWQYIRFEPIAVIDIQVHRDSTGNVYFPMKLKYKNTGEVVSHNAVILSDGKSTFDRCFHNIPPEKEYPTVKHWKAIKDLKLVLGMNKQEVQLVWGIPADINTSKGSWGVHEQWVYPSLFGGRSRYLYFKNGRLSAIQE